MMLHTDLSGILDLLIAPAESGHQSGGGHGAGNAHFTLASDLRTGDGSILLIKDADGTRRKEETHNALARGTLAEFLVVVQHSRDNAGCAVRGRGDYLSTGGILFVHGNREQVHPVHDIQRIV